MNTQPRVSSYLMDVVPINFKGFHETLYCAQWCIRRGLLCIKGYEQLKPTNLCKVHIDIDQTDLCKVQSIFKTIKFYVKMTNPSRISLFYFSLFLNLLLLLVTSSHNSICMSLTH